MACLPNHRNQRISQKNSGKLVLQTLTYWFDESRYSLHDSDLLWLIQLEIALGQVRQRVKPLSGKCYLGWKGKIHWSKKQTENKTMGIGIAEGHRAAYHVQHANPMGSMSHMVHNHTHVDSHRTCPVISHQDRRESKAILK